MRRGPPSSIGTPVIAGQRLSARPASPRRRRRHHRDDVDDQRAEDQAKDTIQNIGLDRFDLRLQARLGLGMSILVARLAPRAPSRSDATTASACGSVKPASRKRFATFTVSIAILEPNPDRSSGARHDDGTMAQPRAVQQAKDRRIEQLI